MEAVSDTMLQSNEFTKWFVFSILLNIHQPDRFNHLEVEIFLKNQSQFLTKIKKSSFLR